MSDTTTITPEERAEIRAHFERKYTDPCREAEYGRTACLRLLRVLEITEALLDGSVQETRANFSAVYQVCTEIIPDLKAKLAEAEARAEKAEDEKTALEEDMEATEKSLKEYSGFFEELCAQLKENFPKQYAELEGDEYGEDAFGVHELFEFVINPVIQGAKEQAEANVARLTKMVDWLAMNLSGYDNSKKCTVYAADWAEAARRAVAAGEEQCQK